MEEAGKGNEAQKGESIADLTLTGGTSTPKSHPALSVRPSASRNVLLLSVGPRSGSSTSCGRTVRVENR